MRGGREEVGEHEREEGGGRRGIERAVTDKTMVATWLARARQKPNGAQNENLGHLVAHSAPGAQIEFETQMLKFLAPFAPEYKNYRKMVKYLKKWLQNAWKIPLFSNKFPIPKGGRPLLKPPARGAFGAFSKQIWRYSVKKMWPAWTKLVDVRQAARTRCAKAPRAAATTLYLAKLKRVT